MPYLIMINGIPLKLAHTEEAARVEALTAAGEYRSDTYEYKWVDHRGDEVRLQCRQGPGKRFSWTPYSVRKVEWLEGEEGS